MKKKMLAILSIFLLAIFAGCVTGPNTIKGPGGQEVTVEEGKGPGWCKAGMQITSSSPQGGGSFIIKGITKYQEREVCEAEWITDEGTTVQYFTEDGSYTATIVKDKTGKVIQEFNYSVPK